MGKAAARAREKTPFKQQTEKNVYNKSDFSPLRTKNGRKKEFAADKSIYKLMFYRTQPIFLKRNSVKTNKKQILAN